MKTTIVRLMLSEHLMVLDWEFVVERSFHGLMQQSVSLTRITGYTEFNKNL